MTSMTEKQFPFRRLEFGPVAPTLADQLSHYPISADTISQLQTDHDAIIRLSHRGVLSAKERSDALHRLTGHIRSAVISAVNKNGGAKK